MQFSIATALIGTTAVAIFFLLVRWERTFPYWTLLPAAFFVASCYVSRQVKSPDLAWGLLAIAWLIALIDTTRAIMYVFGMSHNPRGSELQEAVLRTYRSGVILPLFLSLPSVYLALRVSRTLASPARKWLVACPAIAFANVTLAALLIAIFVRYAWP